MFSKIPALHGNWVDLVVIILFLYYIWEGMERGLLLGTVDLAGFFVSFLSALKLYPLAAQLLVANFSLSRGMANAAGFFLVGFFSQLVFSLLATILYRKLPKDLLRRKWNRWLGFIPSLGSGAIFTAFLLTLVVSLPVKGSVKADVVAGKISGLLVRQTQGIERDLKKIFGEAVNETLTFFTISPQSREQIDLNFSQRQLARSPESEQRMFSLINQERRLAGLSPLTFDSKLADLARDHARDMFERGYFSHYTPEGLSPFDRMQQAEIDFLAAGENLALAPSVQLAHQGLMNSPGHRANILSGDFGKVGVGVIDGGIYGMMFVQEFTD